MLNFVLLVVAIVVAQLLTAGVTLFIMFNPKVMEWYMNKAFKLMTKINYEKLAENLIIEDEES